MFILSLALWETILLSMSLPIAKLSPTSEGWSGFEDWQGRVGLWSVLLLLPFTMRRRGFTGPEVLKK